VQALPESFVISEEKRIIFPDRPSHRSAKLVPSKRRSIPPVEEIRSIQHVVAQKLERRSVPLIGSRLSNNQRLARRAACRIPLHRVAQHVEFAHRVHAEQHPARSSRLHVVLSGSGKLHSVKQKEILLGPVPGNSKVVSRGGIPEIGRAVIRNFHHGKQLCCFGNRPQQNLFCLTEWSLPEPLRTTCKPGGTSGMLLGVDAVREFNVLRDSYGAEFGSGPAGKS